MSHARRFVALLFLLLAAAGCNIFMGAFVVPAQVWTGQVFEILVSASTDANAGGVGAILQLPDGFTVEGAVAVGRGSASVVVVGGGRTSAPSTTVAAEPLHHLTEFAGSYILGLSTPSNAQLKVYVRAPATPGAHVLKVALWGSNGVVPGGATSFAAITTPPHAQPITVVPDPVTPFFTAPAAPMAAGFSGGTAVASGDVDGDGRDDLVVCNATVVPGVHALLARPGAPWQPFDPPPTPTGTWMRGVALGDFDGDGHLDLVDSAGRVLYGDGGGSWTPGPNLPLLIPEFDGAGAGDVDGDGRDDVVLTAHTTDAVQVFHSEANRGFVEWSRGLPNGTNGPVGSQRVVVADVTGDGHADIVCGGTIGLRVFAGDGRGGWQQANAGLPLVGAFALGDLDGDGRLEIVAPTRTGLQVAAFTFAGSGWQLSGTLGQVSGPIPRALVVLDHDQDGWPDVAVAETGGTWLGGRLLLHPNVGGRSFGPPLVLSIPLLQTDIQDLATGDFDDDGWPDLVALIDGEPPIVLHNTGSGIARFGRGCGGLGMPAPRTVASGQPVLGSANFALGLRGAPPQGAALLWLGLSRRFASGAPILPYDLTPRGAPGCAVWAAPDALHFAIADGGGNAGVPLPVPNSPVLRRLAVFAQAAVLAPGANPLGLLTADALAIKVP